LDEGSTPSNSTKEAPPPLCDEVAGLFFGTFLVVKVWGMSREDKEVKVEVKGVEEVKELSQYRRRQRFYTR